MRRILAKIALDIAMKLDMEEVGKHKIIFDLGEDLRREVLKEMIFGPITNGSVGFTYNGQNYVADDSEPSDMERLDIEIHKEQDETGN